MPKFQCGYNLIIKYVDVLTGEAKEHLVQDPITIQFSITKGMQGNNEASITVYNMDASVRNSIFTDRILFNEENPKYILLSAGYGGALTTCLYGQIYECSSTLQGTDIVTTMTVIDVDINNQCSITIEAGTSYKEAYKLLCQEMKNLKIGEIGELEGSFGIPTAFNGNTLYAINKITGKHTFIDNGVINTLNDNETLSDYGAYLVSADTGLLGTPIRRDATLEARILFEPTLRIGQVVEIQSTSGSQFNGQYKIFGLQHDCIISGSEAGQRITTMYLMYIEQTTNSNVVLTNNTEGKNPVKIENGKEIPINAGVPSEVYEVYKWIKKNNGDVPNTKTSINSKFTWKELIYCGKNKKNDVYNSIDITKLTHLKTIADKLSDFCNTNFAGKKVIINSGYRTPVNNSQTEGSANNSNHTKGSAIDFKIQGVSMKSLKSVFNAKWKLGLGRYNTFLHVSLNPKERFYG